MGYYSFLCWFVWRFLTAFLAHVNWLTAVYLKCIYFTYWKSFDLLWFWMHLFMCICFESLRPENYLLVWFNLVHKKCTSSSGKSFRQIYNSSYNRKFTKSERKLKEIELQEINDSDSDNSDHNGPSASTNMYPKLNDSDEQAMPTLNVSRKPNEKNTKVNFRQKVEGEGLIDYQNDNEGNGGQKKGILSKVRLPKMLKTRFSSNDSGENGGQTPKTPESDAENGKWTGKFPKLLPSALRRGSPEDEEAKAVAAEEKRLKKEQDKKKKQQLKEIRERRKEYLRKQAEIERRRKLIADSIELLLQCLRLFTTFAMLVGNIHKTFMPSYLVSPDNDIHNPEILMLFTVTMSFEMVLFWTSCLMTYCKQCRLMCRMGCCRFMAWFSGLLFGIFIMYYPFHLASEQLDQTWCKFEYGTELAKFFYSDW